jgi:hypothetical protein
LPFLLWALACCGQQWEIGAAGGYGIYRNGSIYAPAGKAAAGFRNRFTVSAVLGEDIREHVGGEFRYTFQDGDPFLAAGGTKTNIQGYSHSFHYDALFHFRPRREKIRPYVAVGIGAKLFVVSGPENPSAPLREIGRLTAHDEFKPLVTAGGGVKVRISNRVTLRFDFRDYITPFPKKLIAPAPLATGRGIFHQYTPLAGISYVF